MTSLSDENTKFNCIGNFTTGNYIKFYGTYDDTYIDNFHKFLIHYRVCKSTDNIVHSIRVSTLCFEEAGYYDISFVKNIYDTLSVAKPKQIDSPIIKQKENSSEKRKKLLKSNIREKLYKKNECLHSSDIESNNLFHLDIKADMNSLNKNSSSKSKSSKKSKSESSSSSSSSSSSKSSSSSSSSSESSMKVSSESSKSSSSSSSINEYTGESSDESDSSSSDQSSSEAEITYSEESESSTSSSDSVESLSKFDDMSDDYSESSDDDDKPIKKIPIKKIPIKKVPVKKSPVKKAPVKKVPVKKAPIKTKKN